ncbi:hypothetical protein FisN_16Lh221 [Fistulifera solaris]|uniref:Uncharacterized protein n=1 Tax=Fistulifera solaris TaxID=1519565 RepID=A0A1Z5J6S9_FISSO|nr:hypothetical protein FisN_16Lh221 [Fistulifera solaris]|eukprot:GAX09528.1 hypothetical protein FisN_16Lh221 [Fistulifera solaris]
MPEGEKPKVRLTVAAQWDDSVVHSSDYADLPPECGTHAPLLIAAASFCQLYVENALAMGTTIQRMHVTAKSKCNMTRFYRKAYDRDSSDPWKEMELNAQVEADMPEDDLQWHKDAILKKYAAREVNDEHFTIEVGIQVDDVTDTGAVVPKIKSRVDYDSYEAIANGTDPIEKEQKVVCLWEATKPDVITTTFDGDVTTELSSQENVNIGETPGNLPTPIYAYLYGILSQFMTSMAMRMASRDMGLEKFTGTLYTILMNGNKNYDDGLDPLVFDINGGKINLDIVGDASADKVRFAFEEAQSMTPTYLAASGCIDTNLELSKL